MNNLIILREGKLGDSLVAIPSVNMLAAHYDRVLVLTNKHNKGFALYDFLLVENVKVCAGIISWLPYLIAKFAFRSDFLNLPQEHRSWRNKLKINVFAVALFANGKKVTTKEKLRLSEVGGHEIRQYEGDFLLDLASQFCDVDGASRIFRRRDLVLPRQKTEFTCDVLLVPGASIEKKKIRRFQVQNIIDLCSQMGLSVISLVTFSGDHDDWIDCLSVPSNVRLDKYVDPTAQRFIRMISGSKRVVCSDSAALHLSLLMQKDILCISSAHDVIGSWFPMSETSRFYNPKSWLLRAAVECAGCQYLACNMNFKCMNMVNLNLAERFFHD